MNQDQIKEINQHISDALEQWSEITMKADADGWASSLDYSDDDLLNALEIFIHTWSNRAIKDGIFTYQNVTEKMHEFRHHIFDTFGVDTIELANNVLKK